MPNCPCTEQQITHKIDLIDELCNRAKSAALSKLASQRTKSIVAEFVQQGEPLEPPQQIKEVQLLSSSNKEILDELQRRKQLYYQSFHKEQMQREKQSD